MVPLVLEKPGWYKECKESLKNKQIVWVSIIVPLADPSDLDVLLIAKPEDMDILEGLMNAGSTRLSRSRVPGATSYLIKRPSVTGELNNTEITVLTKEGIKTLISSYPNLPRTTTVKKALDSDIHALF